MCLIMFRNPAALLMLCALPLAAQAEGDAQRGALVILDDQRGNCTICHAIPGLPVPEDAQGNIGPSLDGVAGWRDAPELTAIITDPRDFFAQTIMPAYGVTKGLVDVDPAYAGKPILSGDDIADVVAYLMTLK